MHRAPFASLVAAAAVLCLAGVATAQPADKPAEDKPAEGEKKPAEGEKKPAEPEKKKPAEPEKKKPAEPEKKPADAEEKKPADAEKKPADAGDEADGDDEGDEPPPRRTAAPAAPGFTPMPIAPEAPPAATAATDAGKPKPGDKKQDEAIYAEDWWSHARPVFEFHGYFRVRGELFHNFSLGRVDAPNVALWPMPSDNLYANETGTSFGPSLCTPRESGISKDTSPNNLPCKDKTQAGANLRFRLNPELHISDNLRILSQVDLLDDVVLGSTPDGYYNEPDTDGGYHVAQRGGYTPLGAFDGNQAPPSAGVNSLRDSIRVKRVWAEYMTPVGQLRFGRMPSHWGLGILANSGDGPDDDYQSTSDRILFATGIPKADIVFIGAWDFPNEGPTSESLATPQAQPYDLGQLDDVNQWVFAAMRRQSPEAAKLALARGQVVLNGGGYVVYRKQLLSIDSPGNCTGGSAAIGCQTSSANGGTGFAYARRGAEAWIPDLWLQLRYRKFRFEAEAVTVQGSIENVLNDGYDYARAPGGEGWKVRQYGIATEIEQRLVEDKLKLQFMFGWASGDPDVYDPNTGSGGLSPGNNGLQPQHGDNTISTFRFHPNYKVDLILHRNLLTRVEGTYYFRPSVDYDFLRKGDGQRFGGGFAAIWTRVSQRIQSPGHASDLGIELDAQLYFQSKDGSLNDDRDRQGGFYTMLQYGVLFPLAGLGYPDPGNGGQTQRLNAWSPGAANTTAAQVLRLYLGVLF